jgi:phosphoesterase RecJ-like protein
MKDKFATIPEALVQAVNEVGNIVLFTHVHPDGDALGSLFGLADLLLESGKKVFCFLEEPVTHLYDFLPGCDLASCSLDDLEIFIEAASGDLMAMALDCGDVDRLGLHQQKFLQIRPFGVIDHHLSHKDFGTMRWVESSRSSTGEMVYELARTLGMEITYRAAYNLYVAICTDTGSFRYDCTGARTLYIAAELVEKGVRPDEVGGHLFDNFSRERLKLMELVLATMTLHESDQVAFIHVTRQMLVKSGATMQDVEGFIDYPRSLKSVKIAVFLKEGSGGQVSVSMRAKGECDVAAIARSFDGGGHRNAAGFRLSDTSIDAVRLQVRERVSRVLQGRHEK